MDYKSPQSPYLRQPLFSPDMETANKALDKLPEHVRCRYRPKFTRSGEFIHLACKLCYRKHGTGHDALCPYDRKA